MTQICIAYSRRPQFTCRRSRYQMPRLSPSMRTQVRQKRSVFRCHYESKALGRLAFLKVILRRASSRDQSKIMMIIVRNPQTMLGPLLLLPPMKKIALEQSRLRLRSQYTRKGVQLREAAKRIKVSCFRVPRSRPTQRASFRGCEPWMISTSIRSRNH